MEAVINMRTTYPCDSEGELVQPEHLRVADRYIRHRLLQVLPELRLARDDTDVERRAKEELQKEVDGLKKYEGFYRMMVEVSPVRNRTLLSIYIERDVCR